MQDRTLRLPLAEGELVVGSGPDCAVRITHPTVSRRHAQLQVNGEIAEISDLGSRNGTWMNGRRVRETELLAPGTEIVFGTVPAKLQAIREEDLEAAPGFGEGGAAEDDEGRPSAGDETGAGPSPSMSETGGLGTVSLNSVQGFALEALPVLLRRFAREEGSSLESRAQATGAALFHQLPCSELEIRREGGGVLFFAGSRGEGRPEHVEQREGLLLRAAFPSQAQARLHAPLLESALLLVILGGRREASRRSSPEAPDPQRPEAQRPEAPPLPSPATVDDRVRELYHQAAQVAAGEVSILIRGESGTGKEVLASYIHRASQRSREAFVALNCAALPRDLLEAELFGIESGVATGVESRAGKFELAHGGTLFLDEIGDMALETQARILRVLQEQEVYRLGGSSPREAKVRVLAATNRDLEAMLKDGHFRVDLYHRIADWVVQLPPLRERRSDVPNLAAYFLAREGEKAGRRPGGISRAAMEALAAYDWPGNIRQLEKEISRAALFLQPGELLESTQLSPEIQGAASSPRTLKDVLEDVESREIRTALQAAAGDTVEASERLGIGRSTLYRRMKALGIDAGGPEDSKG